MFNEKAKEIYEANKGYWEEDREIADLLGPVIRKIEAAIEAHDKEKFAEKNWFESSEPFEPFTSRFEARIKDTFEDKLADTMIRLLNIAGGLDIDLDFYVENKLKYIETHKK